MAKQRAKKKQCESVQQLEAQHPKPAAEEMPSGQGRHSVCLKNGRRSGLSGSGKEGKSSEAVSMVQKSQASAKRQRRSKRREVLMPMSDDLTGDESRLHAIENEAGLEFTTEDEEPSPEELKQIEEELKESETQLDDFGDELSVSVPREDIIEDEEPLARSAESAIKLYLREIGKVKLLTPEEEIELAERIRKGDQEARERMIKANLRLVVKIAHDYEGLGLPLLDLISEGNIGLMKAVDRFDPKKGGKLSTYAAWWIKQSIKRALANQTRAIRLPVHLVDKISRMRRVALKLQEVLGREPTDEELAEELGTTPYKVAQLKMAAQRPTSLESPIGDEDSKTYNEVVRDEKAEDPGEQLLEKTARELVQRLMEKLDSRERHILKYRFGLDDADEKTLEELGREMGVTRERIRQIQNQALAKLRRELEKLERKSVG